MCEFILIALKRTVVLIAQLSGEEACSFKGHSWVCVCMQYPSAVMSQSFEQVAQEGFLWLYLGAIPKLLAGTGTLVTGHTRSSREVMTWVGNAVLESWLPELKNGTYPRNPSPLKRDPWKCVSRSSFRQFSRCCQNQCHLHAAGEHCLGFWVQLGLFDRDDKWSWKRESKFLWIKKNTFLKGP